MNILVVEDEPGIANFLKQGLEEESYTVDVVLDGREGLLKALSGDYDLLILDWLLPSMSGIEVCRRFREQYQETPIIFVTAKDTVDETIFGLQAGANDYIKKPFHFEELLERINVQLRKGIGAQQLEVGPIAMNVAAHEVKVENRAVQFTPKEFKLLELLLRNKNTACTREKILDSVWNVRFDYDSGVIDVNINAIRRKLGMNIGERYIETVRGVGYIIKEA